MPVFLYFVRCYRLLKGNKNNQILREKKVPPDPAEKITETVTDIAVPLCESEGMELVHVEYQRERAGLILRIYIDKPGGVTLDDCTVISRQLSDLLDIHFEESAPYNLEVSSPGSDRPLVKIHDFQRFEGQNARIKTTRPIEGRKNFKGILLGVSDEDVVSINVDGKSFMIPHKMIVKARLINFNGENKC